MLEDMVDPVRSARPLSSAECVHRKSLIGFRAACEQTWGGEGLAAIGGLLPQDVRERTAGIRPLPDWIPLDDLIAWHVAAWNGPAAQDETVMARHARLTVDQGFGRVKRIVIAALTPQTLAARVGALWKEEYTTGRLQLLALGERSVQLALCDHKYVEIPLMRFIITEVYRYVLGMTRARNVSASYAMREGSLTVTLRWQ